jgi:flagellar L-ring protein precursor FlgH
MNYKINFLLILILLAGCQSTIDRLNNIGKAPQLNQLEVPMEKADYQPVKWNNYDQHPPQEPQIAHKEENVTHQLTKNSLWKPGGRTFFRDQRARRIGDILKVSININDNVNMGNKTEQIRNNKSNSGASFFGLENKIKNFVGRSVDPLNLISAKENDNIIGEGKISRNEAIKTQVAAIVTQILPNGNLIIKAHQEVRVNYEIREVKVEGIVRPEDITSDNIINSDLIAEARISYGGRGNITNLQQPRWGNQVLDAVSPF